MTLRFSRLEQWPDIVGLNIIIHPITVVYAPLIKHIIQKGDV